MASRSNYQHLAGGRGLVPSIELIRPLELSPTGGNELTIVNRGSHAAYYGQTSTVSATNKTGTLNVGESLTLTSGVVWFVAEKTPVILETRESPIVPAAVLGAEAVAATNLAANSVETGKVKNEAITEAKLAKALLEKIELVPGTEKTVAYTLKPADAGTCIEVNSASAIAITVPKVGFVAGQVVEFCKLGTGEMKIEGEAGFTLHNPSSAKLRAQYSTAGIRFLSATEGVLSGDLE
jgi:hypothetical protein